jgi:hypothetical protein
LRIAELGYGPVADNASVVYDDVYPAVGFLRNFSYHLRDSARVGNIRSHGMRLAAVLFDLGYEFAGMALAAEIINEYHIAFAREFERELTPYASRSAGN